MTSFAERLGLRHPLVVAPMAGGPSSVELVAASCEAGALGSGGAAYMTPDAIRDFAAQVRAKTDRPFAINLFIPGYAPEVTSSQLQKAIIATHRYRVELGLPEPTLTPPYEEDFEAQFAAVMDARPAVFSFVFGLLPSEKVKEAQARGVVVIGTATSVGEAEMLAASGVDAITLQGFEAGGHRGMFDAAANDPEISLSDLLQDCVGRIKIPLIAAGGIMNAEDVRAALSAGAAAVQMGTAFLACREAGTSAPYREALLHSPVRETKTTRVFSGRLARGLRNRFMEEMEARGPDVILPFQAQNKFTRDLRAASVKQGLADFLSLWAGTGEGELWQGGCGELIETLFAGR